MKSLHEDSSWESQGVTDRRRKARSVLAVSALLVAVAAQAAFGQSVMSPSPDGAPPAITTQIDAPGSEAPVTSSLTLIDLDALTKTIGRCWARSSARARIGCTSTEAYRDPQVDEGGSRCVQADPALADVFTCYFV